MHYYAFIDDKTYSGIFATIHLAYNIRFRLILKCMAKSFPCSLPKTSPTYLETNINVKTSGRNKSSHFLKETTVPDTLEIYCTENNIKEEVKSFYVNGIYV